MTADYNGWNDAPEDEREHPWEEPEDPAADLIADDNDTWRGDAHPSQGDGVVPPNWPHEHEAGPEYWLNKGMDKADDDRYGTKPDDEES